MATEIIFGGVLSELEPEEAVALLSALVFQVCVGVGCVEMSKPIVCGCKWTHAGGLQTLCLP